MHSEDFFEIQRLAVIGALSFARLAPVFFVLPFLNNNVLTGILRLTIIIIVGIGLWPDGSGDLPQFETLDLLLRIIREAAIGLLLACCLAWPFWVFHAFGAIMDNQRGATLSSSIDPATGVDTSEMANLFNLFSSVIYLHNGGMQLLLSVMHTSYQLCAPFGACHPDTHQVFSLINQMVANALILASPIIATLLCTDMLLGLLSRFAQQLNAFSLSMIIKSGVALMILLLYFSQILPDKIQQLSFSVFALRRLLP